MEGATNESSQGRDRAGRVRLGHRLTQILHHSWGGEKGGRKGVDNGADESAESETD